MVRWASKIVLEWNGHPEIFSQVKENSRQNLLFRTDILQKRVVECLWPKLWKTTIGLIAANFFVNFLAVFLHDYTWNVQKLPGVHVLWRNVVHVLVHFFHCRSFFLAPLKYSSLFCDPRANWVFWKITRASLLFSRLIDLEGISIIPPIASAALSRGRGR